MSAIVGRKKNSSAKSSWKEIVAADDKRHDIHVCYASIGSNPLSTIVDRKKDPTFSSGKEIGTAGDKNINIRVRQTRIDSGPMSVMSGENITM